jgi:hypothetical protein
MGEKISNLGGSGKIENARGLRLGETSQPAPRPSAPAPTVRPTLSAPRVSAPSMSNGVPAKQNPNPLPSLLTNKLAMNKPTTGNKNNNFLNVKKPGDQNWNGTTGYDDRGHAIFDSPENGIRAAALNLRAYHKRGQAGTLLDIVSQWAPTSDKNAVNKPNEYAAFLAKKMGVGTKDKIDIFDKDGNPTDKLPTLLKAMAEFENHSGFSIDDNILTSGLSKVNPRRV